MARRIERIGPESSPQQDRLAAALAALDSIAATAGGDVAERARAAATAARKVRSKGFMRVYIERMGEISDAIEQTGTRKAMTMHVLMQMAATLGEKSQRLAETQAKLASNMGLSPNEMSRAVTVLAKTGAILLRRQAGKSVTWEIDATYASAMPETMRLEAIDRQQRELAKEKRTGRAGKNGAASNVIPLREVPYEEAAYDEDDRQTVLFE